MYMTSAVVLESQDGSSILYIIDGTDVESFTHSQIYRGFKMSKPDLVEVSSMIICMGMAQMSRWRYVTMDDGQKRWYTYIRKDNAMREWQKERQVQ